MSITPFTAAHRICDRGGWRVTNLKLQKILYLAQMIYIGEHEREVLIAGNFEAWDYGPVQPDVYRKARIFGSRPIQDIFLEDSSLEIPEIRALDSVSNVLLDKTPGEMVAITHWDKGAWAKNYVPGKIGLVISHTDIIAEYNARVESAPAPR